MSIHETRMHRIIAQRLGILHKKEILAWCMYDFGAASFVTSVLTVFFGPFITSIAHAASQDGVTFRIMGLAIPPGALYPYLISASVLLQIVLLPGIGALADKFQVRKGLLISSVAVGTVAIPSMALLGDTDVLMGGGLFLIANIAFGASDVLYNAFLPDICSVKDRNAVSTTGWGLGYLGAGILLVFQYILLGILMNSGVSELDTARLALASCGLWWGGVSVWSLRAFPRTSMEEVVKAKSLGHGSVLKQLTVTVKNMKKYPHTLLFLIAFLVYSDGIQTLTSVSTQFGQEEIGLTMEQLAEVILIVQFVGILGAILFNYMAKWLGTKKAILFALVLYIIMMVYAYAWLSTPLEFYIMAAVMGIVLVGSQALSRAAFSGMIPAGKEAEYFGIYEVSERGTSWLGPLFFGLALQFTGSYRLAILCLVLYFLIGAILLARVKFDKARKDANLSINASTKQEVLNHSGRSETINN